MNNLTMFISIILIQFSSISFSQNWDNFEGRLHPDKTFHTLDGRDGKLKNNKQINKTKTESKSKTTLEIKPPGVKNNTNQITPQAPEAKPKKPTHNNRWINGVVSFVLLCLILFVCARLSPVRNLLGKFNHLNWRLKVTMIMLVITLLLFCYGTIMFFTKL